MGVSGSVRKEKKDREGCEGGRGVRGGDDAEKSVMMVKGWKFAQT